MKKSSKIVAVLMAAVMAAAVTGCTEKKAVPEQVQETTATTYNIGVIQLVQHPALDAANKGFFAALDEASISYKVDQQNASGDQSTCQTIAEKLVNDGNDLILAIATPAAQAVAGITTEVPILLTAVTDPAESGLVDTNEAPGGNVSGTSDLTPVKEQMELLQKIVPEAKTVGILYSSAEANSQLQVKIAKQVLDEMGLGYKELTVSNSNEITTVVESSIGKVDVLYTPTDNMIASGMSAVAMIANENKIPIISGEAGQLEGGGLASYGIDYYELGYLTGKQAIAILTEGADISTMPIGYLPIDKCELEVNEEAAQLLGLDLSELK